MNHDDRLKLNEMINQYNTEDQTDFIRELKHSSIIRKEVNRLVEIVKECKEQNKSVSEIRDISMLECNFIFSYYTDIYNRIIKEEIDLSLLHRFLDVLTQIENGELTQHEGAFKVGTILKEIYIDSALKKAENLNKKNEESDTPQVETKQPLNISWKSYKQSLKKNNTK